MKNEQRLHQLGACLNQLTHDVNRQAEQPSAMPRFDQQLFGCRKNGLKDYLQETQRTYTQLQQHINDANIARVNWLAERVIAQVAALQREIATQHLRFPRQPRNHAGERLHKKLTEHHRYEQRLQLMLDQREKQLGCVETLAQQQQLKEELRTLEGRMARCRTALAAIEHDLALQG